VVPVAGPRFLKSQLNMVSPSKRAVDGGVVRKAVNRGARAV
jgi:hypothetical protein